MEHRRFGPSGSSGHETEGRLHFQLGSTLYERGDFAEAAQEFQRAYDASGRISLLYNVYLAAMDADEPSLALTALREYLTNTSDEELVQSRTQLEQRARVLEERVTREEATQPAKRG